MPELIFQTADPWLVVRFNGAALTDSHLIERASAELSERIRQLPAHPKVLLNFRGIEFVSSQVLGLLLTARTQVGELRGTLVLCRVSPKIREALHIAGLAKQFTIEESETAVVGRREPKPKIPGGSSGPGGSGASGPESSGPEVLGPGSSGPRSSDVGWLD